MNQKAKSCAVYIENQDNDFFLVDLSKNEQSMILNLISQIHNGKIKVFEEKQPLERKIIK